MQPNVYQKAINDFVELGRTIPKLDNLVLRGTCIEQGDLIEGWSDLDFSIIVRKLDRDNISEIKNFIQYLRSSNDFKISVTVVTSNDFNSRYHYHGMKPIYYSYEVRNEKTLPESKFIKIPVCLEGNLLLYDCITNLAYLIHDLRSQYFNCGSSNEELSLFTRHLIKRSKFILKNAFFAMDQKVAQDISITKITHFFPEVTDNFLNIIKNTKYGWKSISEDREKLEEIMSHSFEQVNYIYETTINSLNEKEQKELSECLS